MAASRDIQASDPRPADGFGTPAIFAVFGNPVLHSLSPVMHNAAFAATGYNGVYAAIRVKDIRLAVSGLRALGLRGASITIPHKESVLACLDYIDPAARRIKAVNTIVNDAGSLKGFNTDCDGAIQALAEKMPVKGRRVAIIGAGGAARAVAFGVVGQGAHATIFNRSHGKGGAGCRSGADFKPCRVHRGELRHSGQHDPAGDAPQVRTPRAGRKLGRAGGWTRLQPAEDPVREASAGCTTIDGVSMFSARAWAV
jgi:shikimate dehydrogenase